MRTILLALLAVVWQGPVSYASSGEDLVAPLRQFIDAFNKGDSASAYATYAKVKSRLWTSSLRTGGVDRMPRRTGRRLMISMRRRPEYPMGR